MVRVLLDTCVVSELQCPVPDAHVVSSVRAVGAERAFLSVVTVGEILRGILVLPEGRRRRRLQFWLAGTQRFYVDRILSLDLEAATIWGEVSASARKRGRQVAVADGLIAATAIRHGLTVMTRNVSDFEPTGVATVDPWTENLG